MSEMRTMKNSLLSIIGLCVLVLALTGCLGPKPVLQGFTTLPPAPNSDKPYSVDATIANTGPGSGQIEVVVNLTNKQSGETIVQDSRDVELAKGETQHIVFNIDLPLSAKNLDPSQIKVDVDAHYPIE